MLEPDTLASPLVTLTVPVKLAVCAVAPVTMIQSFSWVSLKPVAAVYGNVSLDPLLRATSNDPLVATVTDFDVLKINL